jgi:hypothetical protein
VKRSTKAHLFHFYDVFCEIIAIPRRPPSVWVYVPHGDEPSTHVHSWGAITLGEISEGKAVEIDSRTLAKQCLKELRPEMGIGQ